MMPGNEYSKPLPRILPETEEYWKAAKRHELFLQKCKKVTFLFDNHLQMIL